MTTYRKKHSKRFDRITLIKVLFFVLAIAVIARLFQLQVIKHDYYTAWAERRHMDLEEIKPDRGEILVWDSGELVAAASNQKLYLLYGIPANMTVATATIALIEKVLPMTDEERWQVYLKLNKNNDPYEPIQHGVTQAQRERLQKVFKDDETAHSDETIGFQDETKRVYPQSNLFADVLGFVGHKNDQRVGQYGIEEYFEEELAGQGGTFKLEKDPQGRMIIFGETDFSSVVPGSDVILTLDKTVQFKTCEVLEKWRVAMLADEATAIVLEPSTGNILAMCDKPDFDLNDYSQVEDINIYFNKAVNEAYEPGSVFKAITMAAALDLEKVTPETEYEDKGFLKFGPDTIHNAANKTYGTVNMTRVLEDSINTGAVYAGLKVGRKNLKDYIEKFGFSEKTGITLLAESPGEISSLDNRGEIYTATASYGQGIMTTPLQLAMSYAVIANDGILMQPRIVSEIRRPDGEVENFESQQVRRVISSKTANILKAMLVSVVKNGYGSKAGVDGYYVAGKTGTANIASKQGGYLKDQTNHTFVGFAPVDAPRFVVLIKLSKPKNVAFSSDSATPATGEIIEYLLQYYQIPPDY